MPDRFWDLAVDGSEKQKSRLMSKLKKLNIEFVEDMLCFTDKMRDDELIRMMRINNTLRRIIVR